MTSDDPAAGARRRGLRAVLVAGAISAFGTQMTMLALPWLVLESTGSATRTGIVFAAQVLPIALLGLYGGEVMQRFGAHRTMLGGDLLRAPVIALVPILHGLDLLSFPLLLAIVVLHGVLGVPYYASQRVLVTELIGTDPRGLTKANSVLEGAVNVSAFAGPAVAGTLIVWIGASQVLWIDAVSFTLSATLLLTLVPRVHRARPATAAAGPRGVGAGLRLIGADPFLRQSVTSTITYGFLLRVLAIGLPLLAFERFDGDARLGGLLVAASGAGALAGSLVTYAVSSRIAPRPLMAVSAVLLPLPLWVLVLPVPPLALMAGVALASAAVPLSNAPYFSILSARVPAEYRPKVLQSVITMSSVAGPLGFLVAGVLTDGVGILATLTLVAVLATLSTVNIVLALRHLDRPVEAPPPGAVPA